MLIINGQFWPLGGKSVIRSKTGRSHWYA